MRIYRIISLILSATFFAVGFLFLFWPGEVLSFFNMLSPLFSLQQSAVIGVETGSFFQILAVAYMYVVGMLAFSMYRHPENPTYPFMLSTAKLVSSAVSVYMFIVSAPEMIFITNAVVDGSIGIGVYLLYRYTAMREHLS